MNLVSDRRANLALHAIIVAGLTAGMSAITYARYMDQRADATAREGVTLASILEMKARAAASRRTGTPATLASEPADEDTQTDQAPTTDEPLPDAEAGEAAIFEASASPENTLILRE